MKIVCPACRKAYRVPDESAGKKVKCSCGNRFTAQQNQATDSTAANPPALPRDNPIGEVQTPPQKTKSDRSVSKQLTFDPPKPKKQNTESATLPMSVANDEPATKFGIADPPQKSRSEGLLDDLSSKPRATAANIPSLPKNPESSVVPIPNVASDPSGSSHVPASEQQANEDSVPDIPASNSVAIQVESKGSANSSTSYSRRSSNSGMTYWIGGVAVLLLIICGTVIALNRPNSKEGEQSLAQNDSSNKDSVKNAGINKETKAKPNSKKQSAQQTIPVPQKKELPSTSDVKSEILKNAKVNDPAQKQSATPAAIYVPNMTVEVELEDREVPDWDPATALTAFMNSSGIERERAESALVRGGDEALRTVLEEIRAGESKRANQFATTALCRMLWKFGPRSVPRLLVLAKDESLQSETRSMIVRAIGDIGPSAKECLPDLVKIYHAAGPPQHRSIKLTIVNTFRLIGAYSPDVDKILLEILEDDGKSFSPNYMTVAVAAARQLGPDAKNLVPALRKLLLQNKNISRDAAEALGAIGSPAGSSAKEFIQLINEDNRVVSYRSFHALRDIGPSAKDAIPALIKVLKESKYDDERVKAADALGRMGPIASDALPTLEKYFVIADQEKKGQPPRVSYQLAIARIKGSQLYAVPYIRSALYDNTHNARTGAAKYAGTLGAQGVGLVPDLANIITNLDTKHGVVRLAIHSLGHLGEHGKDGLGALIQFINKEHLNPKGQKTYRMHAITAMAQINSDDRVRRGLEKIARNDPKLSIREHAQRLLFNLGSN